MANQQVWEFVEQNYPNYSKCDLILANEDMLVSMENEGMDTNIDLSQVIDRVPSSSENEEMRSLYISSLAMIYETAILNYLEKQKNLVV